MPALVWAYKVPNVLNPDSAALEVLATILSEGESSRLYRRLVVEKRLLLDVNADNPLLSLDPNLADAHFELANLAAEQHRQAEAIREYLQVIRLRPDFAAAHYRLAQAYQREGETSKAQAEFSMSEKLRGQKAEVRQEE